MNQNSSDEIDLSLDAALARIRDELVPEGPGAALVNRTLARLSIEQPVHPWKSLWEALIMLSRQPSVRYATLSMAILATALVLLNPWRPSIAFAEVAQKVKEARSLSYVETDTYADGSSSLTHSFINADGGVREELGSNSKWIAQHPDQPLMDIFVWNDKQMLQLMVQDHVAFLKPFDGLGTADTWIKAFPTANSADAKSIGHKTIDGVDAQGFTARYNREAATVWADPKTALPLQIEVSKPEAKNEAVLRVMNHFQFDVPLDPALFSIAIPTGYALKQVEAPKQEGRGAVENEIAKLLDMYSSVMDGTFPASLTDFGAYNPILKQLGMVNARFIEQAGFVAGHLYEGCPDGFNYVGKGVHRGGKDQPIFWINPPPGTKAVRVVYGDLHVAVVVVAKLPSTQPTP